MSDFSFEKDTTPDEQTEVSPDSSEAAEPIEVSPVFPEGGEPIVDATDGENDEHVTVELGEPSEPVLEAAPKPDAQGVISLDQNAGFYVSCSNPDCVNYQKVEEVAAVASDPDVTCGPCGHKITDIAAI